MRNLLGCTAALLLALTAGKGRAQDGSLDTSFDPGTGAGNSVLAIAMQDDGKILVGGMFYSYNGSNCSPLVRLQANGSLDPTFNVGGAGPNEQVNSIMIQPDGRIVIGGWFTTYNGVGRKYVARLNSNGSLDASFDPGQGPDGRLSCAVLQPDGRLVIGGEFQNVNGSARRYVARLTSDGTLDASWNPANGGAGGIVTALALQADGRILLGGEFWNYGGLDRVRIARANPDGSADAGFNAGDVPFPTTSSLSVAPELIMVQPDGKIIVGGAFMNYVSTHSGVVRLNADGSVDATFGNGPGTNSGLYSGVFSGSLQADGKVILGGGFSSINGESRDGIARLGVDGSADSDFDPGSGIVTGSGPRILCMTAAPGNRYLIGGTFNSYNGISRNRIARINADAAVDMEETQQGDEALLLAPNPAHNGAWLSVGSKGVREVALLNAHGQVVRHMALSGGAENIWLDTQDLGPGFYMVRLFKDDASFRLGRLMVE
ncbi:MAG: T9SS type A sorting domain-containing protein [Flavobacteriales bacterium]|nr:T9SS type A sorting domain-containing protein [Flavobacteriales bacterium]